MNHTEKFVFRCLIYIAVSIAIVIAIFVYNNIRFTYNDRCVECAPNDLLPFLDPPLPDNIFDVDTAKSPVMDSAIIFLVKFKIESDQFNTHLKSTKNRIVLLEDYSPENDYRKDYWLLPKWFNTKITTGKYGFWGNSVILIDTDDPNNYTVYMKGLYSSFQEK